MHVVWQRVPNTLTLGWGAIKIMPSLQPTHTAYHVIQLGALQAGTPSVCPLRGLEWVYGCVSAAAIVDNRLHGDIACRRRAREQRWRRCRQPSAAATCYLCDEEGGHAVCHADFQRIACTTPLDAVVPVAQQARTVHMNVRTPGVWVQCFGLQKSVAGNLQVPSLQWVHCTPKSHFLALAIHSGPLLEDVSNRVIDHQ